MATPFLNLNLPTPTVTLGPVWADQINAAFEVIDEHDHSNGKGVKVKPNGMNINADLDIQLNSLLNIEAAQLSTLPATITGPTNILKLYSVNNDLYFTNGNGSAVQLTAGGSIVSTPGAAQTFQPQSVTGNVTILSTDTFVYLLVDTTAGRTITLPAASAVSAGRIFIVKDVSNNAVNFPITVNPSGADTIDGESSFSMDINYGCFVLITDGASQWFIS